MYERCFGCKHLESATIFDVSIDFWPVQWFIAEGLHHVHVGQCLHRALIYKVNVRIYILYTYAYSVRIYLLLIIYQNHRIYYSSHANIALHELISTVVHLLHVIPYYPRYIIIDV